MDNKPEATNRRNIIDSALDAGSKLAPKVLVNPITDGIPLVVLRDADGRERIEYIREHFDAPRRKKGTVKLHDAESLFNYWTIHATDASSIYGNIEPAKFTAIFDDHKKSAPDYRQHRAEFALNHSREFQIWSGKNRKEFESNDSFALWLEDQLPDIVNPTGAEMLEIALNFRVNTNAQYAKATRLQDGHVELLYNNNVEGSSSVNAQKVRIPEQFEISIPIYAGINAKAYNLSARLRYKLSGSKLSLWYELIRPHKVVEQAFADLLTEIQTTCKRPVLFGSPE